MTDVTGTVVDCNGNVIRNGDYVVASGGHAHHRRRVSIDAELVVVHDDGSNLGDVRILRGQFSQTRWALPVEDTTGTGIPTVETHDSDSPNWQTMCRTAMAQADAYRELVEDWKRLYHATKAERDALLAACRACVAGESGWGTRMDAAIAKIGGAA